VITNVNPLYGELKIQPLPQQDSQGNWRSKLGKADYGIFNAQGCCIGSFFDQPEAADAVRSHNEFHSAMRKLNALAQWAAKLPAEQVPAGIREVLNDANRQLSEYRKHGVKGNN
jgi:hypothetical protein